MHCSLLSRNSLLISGVLVSHLLVLMCLLSGSFSGERSSLLGVIAVNLVGEKAKPSLLKQSSATSEVNALSRKESLSSIPTDGPSLPMGAEGISHLAERTVRQILYNPKPHYPLASRKLREQGLVVVKLCVNEHGAVGEARISKSSGFQNLDQSALSTLAKWQFTPIAVNSSGFSSQCFQTPVQFSLEG